MRPARHVTAVLLAAAALAPVGCSKNEEQARNTASSVIEKPLPALPSVLSEQNDDRAPVGPAPAAAGAPSTFANGKAAYDARQYSEATAIFEAYTTRRPDNAWGHYMLGLSAWKSGDLVKAEHALEQALQVDPRHLKSYVNLSRVLIALERHDDAIVKLTKAAEVDPHSSEVLRLLGRSYYSKGQTDESVDAYRRAIEADALDAWAMNNLGLVFLETGRTQDALPLFARAMQLRKDVPAFHNNLGMALEHTGRFRAAASAYASALTADPDYNKAKQNLARVEAVKSEREEPFAVADVANELTEEPKTAEEPKPATNTASR